MAQKAKDFQVIVKDTYGRHYGIDLAGTFWRLEKLQAKGVKWNDKYVQTTAMDKKPNREMRRSAVTLSVDKIKKLMKAARG